MNTVARRAVIVAGLLLSVTGCGLESVASGVPGTSSLGPRPVDADPRAPIALVITKEGLAGVPVGSDVPRWVAPGAVAAPDGSAVYATDNEGSDIVTTRVWRIDPRTGDKTRVGLWVVPGGQPVVAFAVEPGGHRLALATFDGHRTVMLPFDPATGGPTAKPAFEGHLEPEAFSTDRQRLFAAKTLGDHYQVTTLDLGAGEQWPTSGYDKSEPPEDMYGYVVQSVLTADRQRLATLYRDPHSDDHTAFVHLLDLQSGVTVCIDLTAPFGTGAPGTDAIRSNPDGTLEVGHHELGTTQGASASIDPDAILSAEPQRHYHVAADPDPDPAAVPDGIASTPGFVRFVALAA